MSEGSLWLIRHGHTVLHGTDGIAGRTDVALSDDGRAAVRALGLGGEAGLRERLLGARWFASPLGRTRESAAILADALAREGARGIAEATAPSPALDARLVELDFGDWEGSTWEAVHRAHAEALAAWGDDWVYRGPPGGEAFAEQAARCGEWAGEHLGAAPGTGRARDALVVAHGGSIRALLCRLLDRPLGEAMRFAVDPAALVRLERDARCAGGWRLVGANLAELV